MFRNRHARKSSLVFSFEAPLGGKRLGTVLVGCEEVALRSRTQLVTGNERMVSLVNYFCHEWGAREGTKQVCWGITTSGLWFETWAIIFMLQISWHLGQPGALELGLQDENESARENRQHDTEPPALIIMGICMKCPSSCKHC